MIDKDKIISLLTYSKTYPFNDRVLGYHTIKIGNEIFEGQRDCINRFNDIISELKNKSIVDFGCCTGGMLHALSEDITYGIGFDKNIKYINTANAIRYINKANNLSFHIFDIDKEDLSILNTLILEKIDVCLMLAIAKWVKRWKELVQLCHSISDVLIFETNGSNQKEQIEYIKTLYNVNIIHTRSLDDRTQHNRMLLLCHKRLV